MYVVVDITSILLSIFREELNNKIETLLVLFNWFEKIYLSSNVKNKIIFIFDTVLSMNGEKDHRKDHDPDYVYLNRMSQYRIDALNNLIKLAYLHVSSYSNRFYTFLSNVPSTDAIYGVCNVLHNRGCDFIVLSNSELSNKCFLIPSVESRIIYEVKKESINQVMLLNLPYLNTYKAFLYYYALIGIKDKMLSASIDNMSEDIENMLYKNKIMFLHVEKIFSLLDKYKIIYNMPKFKLNLKLLSLYDKVVLSEKFITYFDNNLCQSKGDTLISGGIMSAMNKYNILRDR